MPQPPPAVPEGWRNPGQFAGRAEGGPCPGQNKSEEHNTDDFLEKDNKTPILSRRT